MSSSAETAKATAGYLSFVPPELLPYFLVGAAISALFSVGALVVGMSIKDILLVDIVIMLVATGFKWLIIFYS